MKHFFWLWTAQCILIGGGTSASDPERPPVQVSTVLGEEVTFPVRIRDGFEIEDILCLFKGATIARMTPGNNYTVRDERFLGRLYATDDIGSVNIRNLRTEDAGLYVIEIVNKINPTEKETKRYELEIFSRMKAQIIPISSDCTNRTWLISFNCTVNNNTNVSYIWSGGKVGPSVEPILSLSLTESESNLNVCCAVKNPASNASDCVLSRKDCVTDGGGSGEESGGASVETVAIAVTVSGAGCVACAAAIGILYKNMSAKGSKNQTDSSTVYAQVNNGNNGTQGGNHYTRTEEKNPKLKTIYADVQHTQQMEEPVLPNGNHPAPEANITTTYAQLQKPKTKKDETSESLLGSGLDSGSPYDQVI